MRSILLAFIFAAISATVSIRAQENPGKDTSISNDSPASQQSTDDTKPVQVITAAELDAFIQALPPETREISERSMLTSSNRKFLLVMTYVLASNHECEELQLDSIVNDPNAVKADGDGIKTQVTKLAAPNTKDLYTGALKRLPDENVQVFDRMERWIYKGCDNSIEVSVFYREIRKNLEDQESDKARSQAIN